MDLLITTAVSFLTAIGLKEPVKQAGILITDRIKLW